MQSEVYFTNNRNILMSTAEQTNIKTILIGLTVQLITILIIIMMGSQIALIYNHPRRICNIQLINYSVKTANKYLISKGQSDRPPPPITSFSTQSTVLRFEPLRLLFKD